MDTLYAVGVIAVLFLLFARRGDGAPLAAMHMAHIKRPYLFRACWADRLTVGWAVLSAGFLVMLWRPDTPPLPAWGELLLYVVLPCWVALRTLDFLMGGPGRRAARARAAAEWLPDPANRNSQVQPPGPRAGASGTDWS